MPYARRVGDATQPMEARDTLGGCSQASSASVGSPAGNCNYGPMVVSVYIESGGRRCFAGAVEWPGWCRSGKDEASALEALLSYLPRYRQALGAAARGLDSPAAVTDFDVVEGLKGDSGTDFGTPAVSPAADERPIDGAELRRQLRI